MRDNKPTVAKYWEAYSNSDVKTLMDIVDSGAKIQAGQQDWVNAHLILPNVVSASAGTTFTMHEIFANEGNDHFIIHYHAVDGKGVKTELFKVVEFDIYGKISFIRLVTND